MKMMKQTFNKSYFIAQKSFERKSLTVIFCDFPKTKEKSKEVGGI
jgi:hypothetical protein